MSKYPKRDHVLEQVLKCYAVLSIMYAFPDLKVQLQVRYQFWHWLILSSDSVDCMHNLTEIQSKHKI